MNRELTGSYDGRDFHQKNEAITSRNHVVPTREVEEIIAQYKLKKGLTNNEISLLVPKWYPRPALSPTEKRVSQKNSLVIRSTLSGSWSHF